MCNMTKYYNYKQLVNGDFECITPCKERKGIMIGSMSCTECIYFRYHSVADRRIECHAKK